MPTESLLEENFFDVHYHKSRSGEAYAQRLDMSCYASIPLLSKMLQLLESPKAPEASKLRYRSLPSSPNFNVTSFTPETVTD